MWQYQYVNRKDILHYGVPGMKWGVRRYQNKDGTLTSEGQKRATDSVVGTDLSSFKNYNKSIKKNKFLKIAAKKLRPLVEEDAKNRDKYDKAWDSELKKVMGDKKLSKEVIDSYYIKAKKEIDNDADLSDEHRSRVIDNLNKSHSSASELLLNSGTLKGNELYKSNQFYYNAATDYANNSKSSQDAYKAWADSTERRVSATRKVAEEMLGPYKNQKIESLNKTGIDTNAVDVAEMALYRLSQKSRSRGY